jgi:hypothetical protein
MSSGMVTGQSISSSRKILRFVEIVRVAMDALGPMAVEKM